MRSSDAHLEKALEEYNEKVSRLEENGTPRELLDAYINRGCILSMLGSRVSAITDFDDAIDIIDSLESAGEDVDAGYIVKAYISRGELQTESTAKDMADDYRRASEEFPRLNPGCRYYGEKEIVTMCTDCAGDLVDNDLHEYALPFVEKGLSLTEGREDIPSRNAHASLLNLMGETYMGMDEAEKALQAFGKAAVECERLYDEDELGDPMELVSALVFMGDLFEFLKDDRSFLESREKAITVLEDLRIVGALDNEDMLSDLHGDVARVLMAKGKMAEAEKHLLKQVSYNLNGSTDYMDENGIDRD